LLPVLNENVWLVSDGGGIATCWDNVCGIGEPVGLNGNTSSIIPMVRLMVRLALGILEGSLRRSSAARYFARKVCDIGQSCFTENEWSAAKQGLSASTFSRPHAGVAPEQTFRIPPITGHAPAGARSRERHGGFTRLLENLCHSETNPKSGRIGSSRNTNS